MSQYITCVHVFRVIRHTYVKHGNLFMAVITQLSQQFIKNDNNDDNDDDKLVAEVIPKYFNKRT